MIDHWNEHGEWWYSFNDYICSCCGYRIKEDKKTEFRFCPRCGANMDKQKARWLKKAIEEATGCESINDALKALIIQTISEYESKKEGE